MDILIGKLGNQPFQLTEPSISREHAFYTQLDRQQMSESLQEGAGNAETVMRRSRMKR